jgi:hypothetical protein
VRAALEQLIQLAQEGYQGPIRCLAQLHRQVVAGVALIRLQATPQKIMVGVVALVVVVRISLIHLQA